MEVSMAQKVAHLSAVGKISELGCTALQARSVLCLEDEMLNQDATNPIPK